MVACRRVAQDIHPFIEIKNSLEDVTQLVFMHAYAGRRYIYFIREFGLNQYKKLTVDDDRHM